MGTVFAVQCPAQRNRATGHWEGKYDMSPAEAHGTLEYLLPPGNIRANELASALARLRQGLRAYGPDDHVLAVGDPVAIAMSVLVAADVNGGRVSLLKWDRVERRYHRFLLDMNDG